MRTGAIIYPILSSYAPLTTLVSANKIFAVRALQPTTEGYIVYRELSSTPTNTNGPDAGQTTTDPRINQRSILDVITFSVSCFHSNYLTLENIAVEVRNALDREWGSAQAPYNNDVYLDSCIYTSCVDDYDDKFGDSGIYIKHLDFSIRVGIIKLN